ncbi:basic phospholipase A2 PLA-B-like [Tiliqua scincoides]|uniref:basic phospholipase A2 PLA-B-like n=1 Tax=Tiliqua scincoides TaxID=71010 RepID=UPI0034633AA6
MEMLDERKEDHSRFGSAMKQRLLLIILMAHAFSLISSSLLHFKDMIQRISRRNTLIYFNGYGCYCGKGGKGKPRDKIDQCCYRHDCCYERLQRRMCHPYFEHYKYLIIHDDVNCQLKKKSQCSMWTCECDRQASLCLRNEVKKYTKKFKRYPAVLCKEATPRCPKHKRPKGQITKEVSEPRHP